MNRPQSPFDRLRSDVRLFLPTSFNSRYPFHYRSIKSLSGRGKDENVDRTPVQVERETGEQSRGKDTPCFFITHVSRIVSRFVPRPVSFLLCFEDPTLKEHRTNDDKRHIGLITDRVSSTNHL